MKRKAQPTLMRRLRRQRELTLDEVHLATGVAIPTISRVERRLLVPSRDVLARLAKFFRVSTEDLLSNPDSRQEEVA